MKFRRAPGAGSGKVDKNRFPLRLQSCFVPEGVNTTAPVPDCCQAEQALPSSFPAVKGLWGVAQYHDRHENLHSRAQRRTDTGDHLGGTGRCGAPRGAPGGDLLGNAGKCTGKAPAPAPAIRAYAGNVGGMDGTCVTDNGAGFDENCTARLFKPFRRLHRQDAFAGLGIGLATVYRIVRRHGGDIRAEGRPGSGATFCFRLPGHPSADER